MRQVHLWMRQADTLGPTRALIVEEKELKEA